MQEQIKKYLPLGTVVRLKGGQKNLMINGFCCALPENPNEVLDYNGCMYPEGLITSDMHYLFNHDQIEEILFLGFENEEERVFKRRLNEYVTKGTIDGIVPESDEKIVTNGSIEIPKPIETLNTEEDTNSNPDIFNI